ncbi:MAG: hypothetical protein AAF936_08485 [Pseudomonadota bacterium]
MPKSIGVNPGNQTFTAILERLGPQIKEKGNGAYLRFTGAKGLYVKKGIDNRLFGDWIVRNNKFLDAASVIRDAIDREHQGIIVDGGTLGEYVIRTIMNDHRKEHRLTVGDLKKATQYINTGRERGERIAGAYKRSGQAVDATGASASRTAPNSRTITEGRKLMRDAIIDDLEEYFDSEAPERENEDSYNSKSYITSVGSFSDNPRNLATDIEKMADSYMATLDDAGGLCEANLIKLMDQFQKANIPHENIAELVELTDLQRKTDVSGERLNEACHQLEAMSRNGGLAKKTAQDVDEPIAESRRLVHRMKNLPFPDRLEDERGDLFESLRHNYDSFRIVLDIARKSDPKNQEAIDLLEQLTLETYDLAYACNPLEYRDRGAPAETDTLFHKKSDLMSDKNFTELTEGLGDDAAIDEPVSVPKTLFKIHDTSKTMLLRYVVDAYNSALKIVKQAHADFMKAPTKENLEELRISLEAANRHNDRVLENVARAGKIYGTHRVPQAFNEQSDRLKRQRREVQILRGQATRLVESQSPKVSKGQNQAHGLYDNHDGANQYDRQGRMSNASSYYPTEPEPSSFDTGRNGLLDSGVNFNSANKD